MLFTKKYNLLVVHIMSKKIATYYKTTIPVLALLSVFSVQNIAHAQIDMTQKPVLVITNKAMTPSSSPSSPIYSRPSRAPEITAEQVAGQAYFEQKSTVVGKRIDDLGNDLFSLKNNINRLSEQLVSIEKRGQNLAAGYYASIATINTQLQTGTTPGNPRLIAKLDTAQTNLDTLSKNVASLNALAIEISEAASRGSYLLDTTRSTYSLSGAIEEDHVRLAQMEDQINASVVSVDRLLNDINDDITRTTSYLATERNNLRTIALGVTDGNLYGNSLSNHPFSRAPQSDLLTKASYGGAASATSPTINNQRNNRGSNGVRPLAKIRFDKPNVNYEQPVYNAVQNALQRFPNGRFEVLAVHPTTGNAAQVAIESTRARRNAEDVLRKLTQMGISLDQIDMSTAPSPEARSSEVHIFVR